MPLDEESNDYRLLKRLGKALDDRSLSMILADDYYGGRHRSLLQTTKFREKFGNMFRDYHDNFCELVVDSVEERLNIEGFRIPTADARSAQEADSDAWDIWQRNGLDAESQIAHTESLVKGVAYALIWADEDGQPLITIEDGMNMIVLVSPTNRRKRVAALKRWWDADGFAYATLYLPTEIRKFRSESKYRTAPAFASVSWEVREVVEEDGTVEEWPLPNPLGVVPVVPLFNRPRINGSFESEIAAVIPIQDAINKLCIDMIVAAEFGAFRQRWASGIEVPVDETTGEVIEPFESAVSRLWVSPSTDAKFGEFEQTDLTQYVRAIEMLIQHVATITRTPPHYMLGQAGSFPSGESLKATETGLVAKARRKMRHYGEAWEEVIRLSFGVMDDARFNVVSSETIWRDPESRTEGEHVDAIMKQQALGIPFEMLLEKLGYTPQEITRAKQLRAAEALEVAAAFEPIRVLPTGPNAGREEAV